MQPLTNEQIQEALASLDGWRFEDDRLKRSLVFGSFREAVSFLVRLAFEAEAQDHHPEIFNVYNNVDLALNTHDAGGKVTARDVKLAGTINEISWV